MKNNYDINLVHNDNIFYFEDRTWDRERERKRERERERERERKREGEGEIE